MGVAESIRCVIVDDHAIVRDGVRAALAGTHCEAVGDAPDGPAGLELIQTVRPDVALVDLRMPGFDGFELCRQVNELGLSTRIVIYTGFASQALVQRALEAGAAGFVSKDSGRDVIRIAIDAAARGELFIDPMLAARMVTQTSSNLSPREAAVLELMADGLQNAQIASELQISAETVRKHVAHVLRKLDADSRTGAVATALRSSMLL